jgi:tryptophanyl-tRNA synthetase
MSIVLTGDRPSGALHLGHFIGSLEDRLALQRDHSVFIMIADVQALTDYYHSPQLIKSNVFQLVEDYLSVGISNANIFVQSNIKELFELTVYFMNLVSVARVSRNPTVKMEIKQKNLESTLSCGFFCYPISQAADILGFEADLVPVGEDQLPMIEQANEIGRKFNHVYSCEVFKDALPKVGRVGRLLGLSGEAKASKSLNNCIFLNDTFATLKDKVFSMYTDPEHIHKHSPGKVEGNVVFHYLDAFDSNKAEVEDLKAHYRRGGLGDVALKERLFSILSNFLEPIHERRGKIKKSDILNAIEQGNEIARQRVRCLIEKVRSVMFIQ